MDKQTVIAIIRLLTREANITADDLRSASRGASSTMREHATFSKTPKVEVKPMVNTRPSIFDDDPVVDDAEVDAIMAYNFPTPSKPTNE